MYTDWKKWSQNPHELLSQWQHTYFLVSIKFLNELTPNGSNIYLSFELNMYNLLTSVLTPCGINNET